MGRFIFFTPRFLYFWNLRENALFIQKNTLFISVNSINIQGSILKNPFQDRKQEIGPFCHFTLKKLGISHPISRIFFPVKPHIQFPDSIYPGTWSKPFETIRIDLANHDLRLELAQGKFARSCDTQQVADVNAPVFPPDIESQAKFPRD